MLHHMCCQNIADLELSSCTPTGGPGRVGGGPSFTVYSSKLHTRAAFIPQCIHAYYSKCSVASLIVSTLMCVQHTEANSMENSLVSGLA